jgi:hypothetical protein
MTALGLGNGTAVLTGPAVIDCHRAIAWAIKKARSDDRRPTTRHDVGGRVHRVDLAARGSIMTPPKINLAAEIATRLSVDPKTPAAELLTHLDRALDHRPEGVELIDSDALNQPAHTHSRAAPARAPLGRSCARVWVILAG